MNYIVRYNTNDNYLCHYGIKGQRHGVRRFQYEDGSLTPAGKERYAKYTEKTLDASADLVGASGEFTKNQLKRDAALKKAELNVEVSKVTGHTKMAQAKLLAQKGKYALGTAKDAMKLGFAAAKAYYNVARVSKFMDKMMTNSSNQSKTNKDMQSAAKTGTKNFAKKRGAKALANIAQLG